VQITATRNYNLDSTAGLDMYSMIRPPVAISFMHTSTFLLLLE